MTKIDYEPTTPEVIRDPYPFYEALRRDEPVYRIRSTGYYAVSRYDDVHAVLRDPQVFSSSGMHLMMMSAMTGGAQHLPLEGEIPITESSAPASDDLGIDLGTLMSVKTIIASDPPEHGRLRGIVNRGFTPRRIAALEPRIREIAHQLLDEALSDAEGSFDLVEAYSVPLPVRVIAELLGVEPERRADFKRWSDAMVSGVSGGTSPQQMLEVGVELATYFTEITDRRRVEPETDLISALVQAEEGEVLSPAEVIMFAMLLLVAGNETTTNLIGNAALALLAHPDALDAVRADSSRAPAFVEEVLRYDPPVQALFRQTTCDVEIAGTVVPKGSIVLPLFASANRDAAHFESPAKFDIARNTQGHLAFGYGIHFCLGAALARLEARVAFEELLARTSRLEGLRPETEYVNSFMVRGPRSLPLGYESR